MLDIRFPQAIKLLKRSFKPYEHFDARTFKNLQLIDTIAQVMDILETHAC